MFSQKVTLPHFKIIYAIFPLFLLLISISPSYGQMSQVERFEKEFKYSDGFYTIIPMKQEGLFLIRGKEKYKDGKKIWEILILDSLLNEKKTLDLDVELRNQLVGYEYTPGEMYLLYRMGENNRNDLELIQINLNNYELKRYVIKPELTLQLTHFIKAGSNMVFGGYVSREPSILLYEPATNNLKVVPGFFQKDTELVDLRTNQNNTFNVVLIDRDTRDENKLIMRTFDETGKVLLEDIVSIDPRKSLQTGLSSTLEREDMTILGTWGERNGKQSSGFYALPIDPFQDQKISFVHFGELRHFLDFMSPKRAKRIQEKSREEIKAGRIPNYVQYVMPYRVVEYEKGYIIMAEVYQPSSGFNMYPNSYSPFYYNPYYSPFGPWYYPGMGRLYARPYTYGNNPKSSEDVKTYETVAIAFDPSGKYLWDYSIKMDDIKMPTLEQVTDFHYFKSQVVFLYKKESELKAKFISIDGDDAEEVTEKIKLKSESDELRNEKENEGGIRYWFGNSFYVWGYHTIKNNKSTDRVREVFYINKVNVK